MKQLFYILLFLLSGITFYGQNHKPLVALGIKTGMSSASARITQSSGLFTKPEVESLIRTNAGIVFRRVSIKNKPYAGLQLELNYSQRGWKESGTVKNYYERKINYLELPVLSQFLIKPEKKLSYLINFGINLAYQIDETENLTADAPRNRSYYGKETHKPIDYGIAIGGGVNFKMKRNSLQAEFRYLLGLSDLFVADEEIEFSQYRVATLSIAYLFDLRKP